jgi:hypothetical protein
MTNLTSFAADHTDRAAADLRVMYHYNDTGRDAGSAYACFGADHLALIQVGDSQGEDSNRGAYDWWPLTVEGHAIGELRDDATGMTVHVTPETWMAGVGLLLPADDNWEG